MNKTAAALKVFTVDLMTVTTVFHSESLDRRSLSWHCFLCVTSFPATLGEAGVNATSRGAKQDLEK